MRRIDQFGDGKVLTSFLDPKIEKFKNDEWPLPRLWYLVSCALFVKGLN